MGMRTFATDLLRREQPVWLALEQVRFVSVSAVPHRFRGVRMPTAACRPPLAVVQLEHRQWRIPPPRQE
jgi:hypothetical protein